MFITVQSESGPTQQILIEREQPPETQSPQIVLTQATPEGSLTRAVIEHLPSSSASASREEAKRLVAASMPETAVAVDVFMKDGIYYQTASETKSTHEDPAQYEISQARNFVMR